jgi:hypothetical protein
MRTGDDEAGARSQWRRRRRGAVQRNDGGGVVPETPHARRGARVPRVRSIQTDRVCARSTTRRARYDGGDKGRDGGWEMPDGRRSCARGACPSGFAFFSRGLFWCGFARPGCERALTRALLCPPSRFKPIPVYAHGLQNRRRARRAPPRAAAAPTTSGPAAGGGPVSCSAFRKGRKKNTSAPAFESCLRSKSRRLRSEVRRPPSMALSPGACHVAFAWFGVCARP